MAALAVMALLAAVGTWQLSSSGGAASVAQRPEARPSVAEELFDTYYIVSSQEQADRIAASEEHAAQIRAMEGDFSPSNAHIIFADDYVSLSRSVQMILELNDIRHLAGLPEDRIIDLRD